ncbi:hypothetical protein RHGRI_009313 [Rhododendron griersonianum]|uniref:Uncharacterized protein n=1 Tax=Rhododendron griersonianum TaxID=479676 RepID=A0AAV6L584_9ERIC|nr:hypothetical protein RHGRI_009313 [Rhododendron griersonianum]
MDIEDWVEQEHQAFVSLESKDTQLSWWEFIGPAFIPIFRYLLFSSSFIIYNVK